MTLSAWQAVVPNPPHPWDFLRVQRQTGWHRLNLTGLLWFVSLPIWLPEAARNGLPRSGPVSGPLAARLCHITLYLFSCEKQDNQAGIHECLGSCRQYSQVQSTSSWDVHVPRTAITEFFLCRAKPTNLKWYVHQVMKRNGEGYGQKKFFSGVPLRHNQGWSKYQICKFTMIIRYMYHITSACVLADMYMYISCSEHVEHVHVHLLPL
jgi:hypothetical protein